MEHKTVESVIDQMSVYAISLDSVFYFGARLFARGPLSSLHSLKLMVLIQG